MMKLSVYNDNLHLASFWAKNIHSHSESVFHVLQTRVSEIGYTDIETLMHAKIKKIFEVRKRQNVRSSLRKSVNLLGFQLLHL